MFSQLRQGSMVYILDSSDTPKLVTGQVIAVSQPQPKYNTSNPAAMIGMQPDMVMDITVKTGEKEYELKQIHANMSIEHRPDIKAVISDTREAMLQEVDMMQAKSQQIVDSFDYNKGVVKACEVIKRQLNPNYEKEQKRDEQIEALNKRFDAFETKFGKAIDQILAKA